jgi:hypothetical protein
MRVDKALLEYGVAVDQAITLLAARGWSSNDMLPHVGTRIRLRTLYEQYESLKRCHESIWIDSSLDVYVLFNKLFNWGKCF